MVESYCMWRLFSFVKIFVGEVIAMPAALRRRPMFTTPFIGLANCMTALKRARAASCFGERGLLLWLLYTE